MATTNSFFGGTASYVNTTNVYETGDIITSINKPSTDWLPCDGSLYLKSAYPDLATKLNQSGILFSQATNNSATIAASKGLTVCGYTNNNTLWLRNSNNATNDNALYKTTNGKTYSSVTMPQSWVWSYVAYGNNTYVTAGVPYTSTTNVIYVSANGSTWTAKTLTTFTSVQSVNFSNNLFTVCVHYSSTYYTYTSTDGVTWTLLSTAAISQTPLNIPPLGNFSDILISSNTQSSSRQKITLTNNDGSILNHNIITFDNSNFDAAAVTLISGIYISIGGNVNDGVLMYNDKLYAIVKRVDTYVVTGSTYRRTEYLLASSTNNGKHWSFVKSLMSSDTWSGGLEPSWLSMYILNNNLVIYYNYSSSTNYLTFTEHATFNSTNYFETPKLFSDNNLNYYIKT